MDSQPKWIGTSVTVAGSLIAAGGAIWGLSDEQAAEAERIIQGIITLVGSAVAFYGRLRASSKVTLMPGGK